MGSLKHQQASQGNLPPSITFDDQPFVGMWRDRVEMNDSRCLGPSGKNAAVAKVMGRIC